MSERPEDWDEAFLRYLGGEADEELERRVRERLMSDEEARDRFVTLACQQQALADVLAEAAGRAPTSRTSIPRLPAPRARKPGYGWMLAAAAVLLAALGYWLSGSDSEPRRKEVPLLRPEARSPEKLPPSGSAPTPSVPVEKTPSPPRPSDPPKPGTNDFVVPKFAPKPTEKDPEAPKPEDPKPPTPAPAPKTNTPTRVVTETVVATIERVQGEVAILGGATRVMATVKQSLVAGQSLETAATGIAELSFADGTILRLEPGTLVKDLADDAKGKRLFLAKGGLWADVRKQPAEQPMTLTTPNGEAKVLGTKLRLFFDESAATRLEVEEGKVRLKRLLDGKFVDVTSGHFAVAINGTELKALPAVLLGLAGYWKFEDQTGTTMTDSSGLGNHGMLLGKARRTLGKFGQGLDLDGATAMVQIPHTPSLNPGTSGFSLSVWVRNKKESQWLWNLFFKDDGKLMTYFYFAVGTKPRFEFATGDAKVTVDGQANVNDNRWHHLVAVRNATYSAQLYVDGVLDSSASVAATQTPSIRTTTPLVIGGGNGSFYAGQLDDARYYNRALTPEEVRQLYAGR